MSERLDAVQRQTQVDVAAVGPRSTAAPSFAVRVLGPSRALRSLGIEIKPLTLFDEAEEQVFRDGSPQQKWRTVFSARKRLAAQLASLGPETTTTLIQRQADVFASLDLERRAVSGRRLVYDVDDAIWLDGPAANGSAFAFIKGSRRKVKWLARRADHVLAGNDYLAEHLSRFSEKVTVVPSLVDIDDYPLRRHEDRDVLTVGWIGSRTTTPYLQDIARTFSRLGDALAPRRVRLLTVGAGSCNFGFDHRALPWTPENQHHALMHMDIGVVPQPDRPWVRGKCAYKALQYMAAGIPVVADDVGVTATVVGSSAGYIATSEDEWVEGLTSLALDSGLRSRMGHEGRRRVEEHFSLERWAPAIAATLGTSPPQRLVVAGS